MGRVSPTHNDAIRSPRGDIVGYVTEDLEGNRYAWGSNGGYLGDYRKRDNKTYFSNGGWHSIGDATSALVWDNYGRR